MFADLCVYNQMFQAPASIPALVDIAVRSALSRRGVAHLTFPVDMQEADPEQSGFEGGLDTSRTRLMPAVRRGVGVRLTSP